MNSRKTLKQLVNASLMGLGLWSAAAWAGFSVSGTQLLDGNGQPFVMRGINHAHTWFTDKTAQAIPAIAATGANVVRVVLSNGTHKEGWRKNTAADVTTIINLCKNNKIICMLEVHDTTGYGEKTEATTLADAAKYWVEIASALKGQENYVLINIGNEPFGNGDTVITNWVPHHKSAIQTIRNAGLTHTLIVDAPSWGQDWKEIMLKNASEVAKADSLSNTMFSVHMYEVYQDYNKINTYISTFLRNHNLPIIVGEFGADHQGKFVDAESIMRVGEEKDVGYLGWSWSGNGSCCGALDITNNFNAASLSTWGTLLINGTNGIKKTSVRATVFGGVIASSSSSVASTSSRSSSSLSSSRSSSSSAVSSSIPLPSSSSSVAVSSAASSAPATTKGGSWNWMSLMGLMGLLLWRKRSA